jgi:hypothetical protein
MTRVGSQHNRGGKIYIIIIIIINSSLSGFKRGRVTDQTLVVCYYTKHVLIIQHVLSITAFC